MFTPEQATCVYKCMCTVTSLLANSSVAACEIISMGTEREREREREEEGAASRVQQRHRENLCTDREYCEDCFLNHEAPGNVDSAAAAAAAHFHNKKFLRD